MAFEMHAVDSLEYVHLVFAPETTLRDLEESRGAVLEELTARQWHSVLLDSSQMMSTFSPIDIYTVTSSLGESFGAHIRMALVIRPDQLENGTFSETVAQNRGFQLRCFVDRSPAQQWLADSQAECEAVDVHSNDGWVPNPPPWSDRSS